MKKLFFSLTLLFTIKCVAQNVWTQKANFPGVSPTSDATGFSIGTKGYIGAGIKNNTYTNDFWEYDPTTDTWTQKADFGGGIRANAVGFSIGQKGYMGTGRDGSNFYNDFWQYDPAANTWTQKANFGGTARAFATGISIGSKGYITTGLDVNKYLQDLWEYDTTSDAWTIKADYPGGTRRGVTGFSIGTKGYIGTGMEGGFFASPQSDFWEYDPATNTWLSRADFGGFARVAAVGFSIDTLGYIGTGGGANDFWEFDPSLNTWTQKADFGGTGRTGAVGFSIGNRGYIGTSQENSSTEDFWEYSPASVVPVMLTKVKAFQQDESVQVEWTTQQENNIDKYELERSKNGQQFSALQSLNAKGNSSVINNYDLIDLNPLPGLSFYRIKIIDKSGHVSYSEIIRMSVSRGAALISIYPNPIIGNTIILQMSNLPKGNYTATLLNKAGQRITTKIINHAGGSATETIEAAKALAAGTYQLMLSGTDINLVRQVIKK